jgi:hypothetical protein
MQISIPKRSLNFADNRVLFPFSIVLLVLCGLFTTSVILHWPEVFRSLGSMGLALSPAFLILTCWDMVRYQRKWRTFLAAFISLLATATGWSTIIFYVAHGFH